MVRRITLLAIPCAAALAVFLLIFPKSFYAPFMGAFHFKIHFKNLDNCQKCNYNVITDGR